jgi:hypothetical protein
VLIHPPIISRVKSSNTISFQLAYRASSGEA